jgi:hypothetical protein
MTWADPKSRYRWRHNAGIEPDIGGDHDMTLSHHPKAPHDNQRLAEMRRRAMAGELSPPQPAADPGVEG